MMRFTDRAAAGRLLAPVVAGHALDRPVVVGIGPGGRAVGVEVARILGCPVEMLDVEELVAGDALHPGRAFGALSSGGHVLVRPDALDHLATGPEPLGRAVHQARAAISARAAIPSRAAGAPVPVRSGPMAWRTVILVDDGSSSRRVLAAALDLARAARPGRVLLAVPVAPQETLDELTAIFGEVMVAVVAPWTEWFAWHGRIYDDDTRPGGSRLQPEPIG